MSTPETLARLMQVSTQPRFTVAGQEQPALSRDNVLVQIDEDIDGLQRLCAQFIAMGAVPGAASEGYLYLDGRLLDFGTEVKVGMGPTDARVDLFTGRVSGMELDLHEGRAPEVMFFAEDRLMDLRMTRRFKTYEDASDADMLQQIAAQHGLRAQADVSGPRLNVVQQWNQSDLAFLRERARRLGADVWVDNDTLRMASRDQRPGPRLTLVQGRDLVQLTATADLAHQRSEVQVGGFDDVQAERIDERAAADVVASEAQGQTHGLQVLQRAFGSRTSHRVREVPLKGEDARAWARATLLTRARRFVQVRGVAQGSTELRVGAVLRLERVSPMFEGDGYYVTRVRHTFDLERGHRTQFEAERAWIGQGG